ncbi:MAG: C25 family cysteine peptidase, partial [candidate division WOR-3 bacterium]
MKTQNLILMLCLVGAVVMAMPIESRVNVLSNTSAEISLKVTVPDIIQRDVKTEQGIFTQLTIPHHSYTSEDGKPQIPLIREYIEIPHGAEVQIEARVINSKRFELKNRLMPKQPSICKTGPPPSFMIDEKAYEIDRLVPEITARVEQIVQIRNHRVAIVEIYPVRYNARTNQIELLTDFVVTLKLTGSNLAATYDMHQKFYSPPFEANLRDLIRNYQPPQIMAPPPLPIRFLIIVPDAYYNNILPLANWRRKMGYKVRVTKISQIGGGDTARVRNYIINTNNTWPITYVTLVGDIGDIGYFVGRGTGTPPTDLYYSAIIGSDYFPDLYLSRMSIANAAQLDSLVQNVIQYEKATWASNSFCKRSFFIASDDGGNHQIAESTHRYCARLARRYGMMTDSLWLYYCSVNEIDSIKRAVNVGMSWVMYSGHGSDNMWADPDPGGFTTTNVHELSNVEKLPFVGSFCCLSGNYTGAECFSESWIRNGKRGAIAHMASSVTSFWDGDDILQRRMYDCAFDSLYPWPSGLMNKGKMILHREWSTSEGYKQRYFEMYNIMGDGAVDLYWDYPKTLTVSHPAVIPVGIFNLQVNVTSGGNPVRNAL